MSNEDFTTDYPGSAGPEIAVIAVGEMAMCDIIDAAQRPTGEQIEVKVLAVRNNGSVPQSYRVHCKTERETDKIIWVRAEFIHPRPIEPDLEVS